MRRHDLVKVMEAGQAIGSYNARRWIAEIDVPTTVLVTDRDRAIAPAEQLKLAAAIPGAEVQHVDDGHVACAKREFGPALVRAVDSVAARQPRAAQRIAQLAARHDRWDRSAGVRVVEVAGHRARHRSVRWCWPTSAPTSSAWSGPPALPADPGSAGYDVLRRGRRSVAVDLKTPEAVPRWCSRLVERSRRTARGVPARRGRAARHRARRCASPATRVSSTPG